MTEVFLTAGEEEKNRLEKGAGKPLKPGIQFPEEYKAS